LKKSTAQHSTRHTGLHVVALFEGAKGLLVLLTGFGVLLLIHRNVHDIAAEVIMGFHLNPAAKYPRIFLDLADRLTDPKLWALATASFTYAGIRLLEGYGLWRGRRWAEWLGALSGGFYIPFEMYELFKRMSWVKLTVLVLNFWIVGFLVATMLKNRSARRI
jgi:uncharacterized membrane protein (DUF2068 family)